MNWPVFFKRLGSAIIFCAVMLAGLLYEHPYAILVLALLIQFFAIKELFRLAKRVFPEQQYPYLDFLLALLASAYLLVVMVSRQSLTLAPLLLLPVVLFLKAGLSARNTAASSITALLALLYIGIPVAMLVDLRSEKILPVSIVILIWINDTMAYIVGSFMGKTPFSKISPKKTWEGTLGGIILTIAAGTAFGVYGTHHFAAWDWAIIAAIVAVFGVLGDLLESQLKRKADVKDSGSILPGHGGALDRFDSLLIAVPVVYVYIQLFVLPRYI